MPWKGSTPLAEEAKGGPSPYDESKWDTWDGLAVMLYNLRAAGRRV